MEIFRNLADSQLIWLPESGIGYFPVSDSPYDKNYFDKYVEMSSTPMGQALTKARVDLVNKYTYDEVIDIGIGSGAFVSARNNTYGFDINPFAVEWLVKENKYKAPTVSNSLTFWDSLEHIHNPKDLLVGIKEFAFISLPIFNNSEHILKSKHFRKDEHCWYFTEDGIKLFMWVFGFKLLESNRMESDLGREDIGTYVFMKMNAK